MQSEIGKRVWVFPDGELPPAGNYPLKGHESIIILNQTDKAAKIEMTLYFTDQEPWGGITIDVAPRRVRCLRMDNPSDVGGREIPRETQYAIRMKSSVPVIIQYGRLDTRDQPMAFYTNTGYCE